VSRSRSFGAVAELYDLYRPSPPPGLAEHLGMIEGLDVLDVAAGTGLVTRYLTSLGANVTAVEPDMGMRAVLRRRSPSVVVLTGVAEDLPVADATLDLVVTSSAWHWFAQPTAANEFARVLRDGGRIFILGNGLDRDRHWLEDLAESNRLEDRTPPVDAGRHASDAHQDLADPFVDVETFTIPWVWRRSEGELLGLLQTYSAAIVRAADERAVLVERAREELRRAAPDGVHDVPMSMVGARATRRAR
jgi:SAM-dependent methyltransferase